MKTNKKYAKVWVNLSALFFYVRDKAKNLETSLVPLNSNNTYD